MHPPKTQYQKLKFSFVKVSCNKQSWYFFRWCSYPYVTHHQIPHLINEFTIKYELHY